MITAYQISVYKACFSTALNRPSHLKTDHVSDKYKCFATYLFNTQNDTVIQNLLLTTQQTPLTFYPPHPPISRIEELRHLHWHHIGLRNPVKTKQKIWQHLFDQIYSVQNVKAKRESKAIKWMVHYPTIVWIVEYLRRKWNLLSLLWNAMLAHEHLGLFVWRVGNVDSFKVYFEVL